MIYLELELEISNVEFLNKLFVVLAVVSNSFTGRTLPQSTEPPAVVDKYVMFFLARVSLSS